MLGAWLVFGDFPQTYSQIGICGKARQFSNERVKRREELNDGCRTSNCVRECTAKERSKAQCPIKWQMNTRLSQSMQRVLSAYFPEADHLLVLYASKKYYTNNSGRIL
eukprot:4362302-Amphidinium_carterae.1